MTLHDWLKRRNHPNFFTIVDFLFDIEKCRLIPYFTTLYLLHNSFIASNNHNINLYLLSFLILKR